MEREKAPGLIEILAHGISPLTNISFPASRDGCLVMLVLETERFPSPRTQ